jgi:hypothetical protein
MQWNENRMIKLKEKWIDDNEKIYSYIEYYGSDDKLNYYWWDEDYITDEKLIESLNRKRQEYCENPERATNLHLEWNKKNEPSK